MSDFFTVENMLKIALGGIIAALAVYGFKRASGLRL